MRNRRSSLAAGLAGLLVLACAEEPSYVGVWVVPGGETEVFLIGPDSVGIFSDLGLQESFMWRQLEDGTLFFQRENFGGYVVEVLSHTADRLSLSVDGDTIDLVRQPTDPTSPAASFLEGELGPGGVVSIMDSLSAAENVEDTLRGQRDP